jgi:hypothetical protein
MKVVDRVQVGIFNMPGDCRTKERGQHECSDHDTSI